MILTMKYTKETQQNGSLNILCALRGRKNRLVSQSGGRKENITEMSLSIVL